MKPKERLIELRDVFTRTGRGILWFAGGMALLGSLWREPVAIHWSAVVGLAVWAECLVVLFRIPGFPRRQRDSFQYVCWAPVLLLGLLLSWQAFAVYLGLLACFEFLRFFVCRFGNPDRNSVSKAGPAVFAMDRSDEPVEAPGEASFVQRILRTRDEAGNIRIECLFRIEFVEGQKTVSVHVPFWPGFDAPPRVEARLEEDDRARLTIRPPLPNGVRIDIRRHEPGGAPLHLSVIIEESSGSVGQLPPSAITGHGS